MLKKIQEAIWANSHVRHARIKLNYVDGIVVLTGEVGSYYQKQMAQEVVRQVRISGNLTFSIKNDIFVKNGKG